VQILPSSRASKLPALVSARLSAPICQLKRDIARQIRGEKDSRAFVEHIPAICRDSAISRGTSGDRYTLSTPKQDCYRVTVAILRAALSWKVLHSARTMKPKRSGIQPPTLRSTSSLAASRIPATKSIRALYHIHTHGSLT
jgi:hypothetical protein